MNKDEFNAKSPKERNDLKYLTQSDNIPWKGGSLLGYINTDFETLKEVLGEDYGRGDENKTRAEWDILFEDGTHASIYDWKEHRSLENVPEWNVGGTDIEGFKNVLKLLGVSGRKL